MSIVNSAKNVLSESMDMFNRTVEPITSNKYVSTYVSPVVALLLVLYVVMAAPKLPKSVVSFFNYTPVKIIYMFLIVYLATHDPSLAIITTVVLFVMLQQLSAYEAAEKIVPKPTTDSNIFTMLLQKADSLNQAAQKALNMGNKDLAQKNINEAAKLEAAAESLTTANVHKHAAMDAAKNGDNKALQNHVILAIKHDMNAKQLAMKAPKQQQDDVHSEDSVVGYNPMRGNEDYGRTSCDGNIDLSKKGNVRGAREHFEGDSESFDNNDQYAEYFTNTEESQLLNEQFEKEQFENKQYEKEQFENKQYEKEQFENKQLENEQFENEQFENEQFENKQLENEQFENSNHAEYFANDSESDNYKRPEEFFTNNESESEMHKRSEEFFDDNLESDHKRPEEFFTNSQDSEQFTKSDDIEHFASLNTRNSRPVSNAFNNPRTELSCKVSGLRKFRDNDLGNYAPFNASQFKQNGKRGINNTRVKKVQSTKVDAKKA